MLPLLPLVNLSDNLSSCTLIYFTEISCFCNETVVPHFLHCLLMAFIVLHGHSWLKPRSNTCFVSSLQYSHVKKEICRISWSTVSVSIWILSVTISRLNIWFIVQQTYSKHQRQTYKQQREGKRLEKAQTIWTNKMEWKTVSKPCKPKRIMRTRRVKSDS